MTDSQKKFHEGWKKSNDSEKHLFSIVRAKMGRGMKKVREGMREINDAYDEWVKRQPLAGLVGFVVCGGVIYVASLFA